MGTTIPLDQRLDNLVRGYAVRSLSGDELAEAISYSPAHTNRLFRSLFGESPGAFRRRLMLERAAEQLVSSDRPIWQIALECGFASAEPFIRAFRRAYRVNPSAFRQLGSSSTTWLRSGEDLGLHYWRGTIVSQVSRGEPGMNLTDRMIAHDVWLTSQMLEKAQALTDEQLDAPLPQPIQLTCYEEPEKTLREVLNGQVFLKEVWLGAMYNRQAEFKPDKSTDALLDRWSGIKSEYEALAADLQNEDRWDDQFVDAMCVPPVTFTFGSVFAHILTHSAVRRYVVLGELRRLGFDDLGFGEPVEWEQKTVKA